MKFAYAYSSINPAKLTFVNLQQHSVLFALAAFSFLAPFLLHSQDFPNQLLVGSFVNALLACSALYLTFKNSAPIILLPSIAAVLSGFVFGSFSPLLALFVPAIWLGNAAYVYVIKSLAVIGKLNYALSVIAAALLKATIIGITAFALVAAGAVPAIFLFPMSVVQFATALIGGLASRA